MNEQVSIDISEKKNHKLKLLYLNYGSSCIYIASVTGNSQLKYRFTSLSSIVKFVESG